MAPTNVCVLALIFTTLLHSSQPIVVDHSLTIFLGESIDVDFMRQECGGLESRFEFVSVRLLPLNCTASPLSNAGLLTPQAITDQSTDCYFDRSCHYVHWSNFTGTSTGSCHVTTVKLGYRCQSISPDLFVVRFQITNRQDLLGRDTLTGLCSMYPDRPVFTAVNIVERPTIQHANCSRHLTRHMSALDNFIPAALSLAQNFTECANDMTCSGVTFELAMWNTENLCLNNQIHEIDSFLLVYLCTNQTVEPTTEAPIGRGYTPPPPPENERGNDSASCDTALFVQSQKYYEGTIAKLELVNAILYGLVGLLGFLTLFIIALFIYCQEKGKRRVRSKLRVTNDYNTRYRTDRDGGTTKKSSGKWGSSQLPDDGFS